MAVAKSSLLSTVDRTRNTLTDFKDAKQTIQRDEHTKTQNKKINNNKISIERTEMIHKNGTILGADGK